MNIIKSNETPINRIETEAQALVKLASSLKDNFSIVTVEGLERKVAAIVSDRRYETFHNGLQFVQKSIEKIKGKLKTSTEITNDCIVLRNRIMIVMQSVLPKPLPFSKEVVDKLRANCLRIQQIGSNHPTYKSILLDFENFVLSFDRPFLEHDKCHLLESNVQTLERHVLNSFDIVNVLLNIFDINVTPSLAQLVCNSSNLTDGIGKVKMMRLLIDNGLDVDKALCSIVGNDNMDFPLEILQILIEQGATITKEMTSKSCLYQHLVATSYGYILSNQTPPDLMRNQFTLLVYNGATLDVEGLKLEIGQARVISLECSSEKKLENLTESVRVRDEALKDLAFLVNKELIAVIRNNPPEILDIVSAYFMSPEEAAGNPMLRALLVKECRKKRDYTIPFHAVPEVKEPTPTPPVP